MSEITRAERGIPLREQVLANVLQAVRAGTFLPGERLTEERLAEILGVSRTPVREALGVLAQRGIVTRREGSGFTVSTPSRKNITDIFELRGRLEPYAIRRAATLITPAQLKQLSGAVKLLRALVNNENSSKFTRANQQIRHLLFSLAGNEALADAIRQLDDHVHFIGMLTMKDGRIRQLVLAKHQQVFAALSRRDAEGAEKAMHTYLEASCNSLLAALPKPTEGGKSMDTLDPGVRNGRGRRRLKSAGAADGARGLR